MQDSSKKTLAAWETCRSFSPAISAQDIQGRKSYSYQTETVGLDAVESHRRTSECASNLYICCNLPGKASFPERSAVEVNRNIRRSLVNVVVLEQVFRAGNLQC